MFSQLLFLTHNNNKYQSIKDIQSNDLYSATMTYDKINDDEATPLKIQGGYSDDATGVAPSSTKNKRTSSSIVRDLMIGTAVAVGVLLVMAGPSSMTTMNKSSNVEGWTVTKSVGLAWCTLNPKATDPETLAECSVTHRGLLGGCECAACKAPYELTGARCWHIPHCAAMEFCSDCGCANHWCCDRCEENWTARGKGSVPDECVCKPPRLEQLDGKCL